LTFNCIVLNHIVRYLCVCKSPLAVLTNQSDRSKEKEGP